MSGNSVYIWALASSCLFAIACYFVARAKGRNIIMWTAFGFLFSWIALLIVAIMPHRESTPPLLAPPAT